MSRSCLEEERTAGADWTLRAEELQEEEEEWRLVRTRPARTKGRSREVIAQSRWKSSLREMVQYYIF